MTNLIRIIHPDGTSELGLLDHHEMAGVDKTMHTFQVTTAGFRHVLAELQCVLDEDEEDDTLAYFYDPINWQDAVWWVSVDEGHPLESLRYAAMDPRRLPEARVAVTKAYLKLTLENDDV